MNRGIFVFAAYLFFCAVLLYNLFHVAVKAKKGILGDLTTTLLTALVGMALGRYPPVAPSTSRRRGSTLD